MRSRHESNLQAVRSLGLNSSVLVVPPPKPKKKSFVAPPSTTEQKFQALKESSSVGTIWWAVGAKAFNAPDVTEPAVARLQERNRKEEEERKAVKAAADWDTLRAAAQQIEQRRQAEQLAYDALSASELKQLVAFVFRARKQN